MYPSLVEVDRSGVCSLYCEVEIVCWLQALSLFGRGVGCCLAKGLPLLCEVVFVLREEFGTPIVVTNPPRWEIVDWKSFTVVKAGM